MIYTLASDFRADRKEKKSVLLKCSQTAVCLSKTLLGIITECEHLSFLTNRKCMLHYWYVNQSDSINFMVFNSSPPPAEPFAHPKLWILKGTWLRRKKKMSLPVWTPVWRAWRQIFKRFVKCILTAQWLDRWPPFPAAGIASSCFCFSTLPATQTGIVYMHGTFTLLRSRKKISNVIKSCVCQFMICQLHFQFKFLVSVSLAVVFSFILIHSQ